MKQTQQLLCISHKTTISKSAKTEQKIEKKNDTQSLFPHPNPNINEPPVNLPIPLSFAVTT